MTDRSAPLRGTLPCPFCSAPGDYSHAEEVAEDVWTVICEACGANGTLDLDKPNTPLIIVPLVAGIGDMEDELYTLNETGKAIWDRLDGRATLRGIIADLTSEFNAPQGEIEHDVLGMVEELVRRRMLVEATAI